MVMLKKLIITCLVISTFGYGMAWAFDGHWDDSQAQYGAQVGQHADHESPATDQHDTASCDHCCHANAHLTGLAVTGTGGLSADCSNIYSTYTATLISFLDNPASPPPRH